MNQKAKTEDSSIAQEGEPRGALSALRKTPYGAKLNTGDGVSLFIVTGQNTALLLNQGDPLTVTIDVKRLTPCTIKYVISSTAD